MKEQQILSKIKQLKEIKPRQNWVILTKRQILGEEQKAPEFSITSLLSLNWKPVYAASALIVIITMGLTFLVQNSYPGDALYSVKKATEDAQVSLSSVEEKSKVHLQLANKRLEELDSAVKSNRTENLAPAIKDFQTNIAEAAKNLTSMESSTSSNPALIKEIVSETQKLNENKKKVESMGIIIGDTSEWQNALASLVQREFDDLLGRTLTDEQYVIFNKARTAYQELDYAGALENLLLLNTTQNK